MDTAIYHSDRGEKSALLLVKANKFEFSAKPAYVPRTAVQGHEIGDEIQIPDGYEFKELIDVKTGEVLTTKNGEPLHTLSWG